MIRSVLTSAVMSVALFACGPDTVARGAALDELNRRVADAKACGASDECILAAQSNCTCEQPVNAKAKARIDEAVSEVNRTCSAEEFLADCVAWENPRCDAGKCVADAR